MLRIEWGNDLRELARRMFRRLDGAGKSGAEELFLRRDLVAAANRVQLGWLKLEAMYRSGSRRVWALRETATMDDVAERIVREGRGGRCCHQQHRCRHNCLNKRQRNPLTFR